MKMFSFIMPYRPTYFSACSCSLHNIQLCATRTTILTKHTWLVVGIANCVKKTIQLFSFSLLLKIIKGSV